MNTDNGALAFDFYLDNGRLQQTALEAERRIKGLTDSAINEGKRAEGSFDGFAKTLAAIGGTAFVLNLGKQIIETTGQFQQLNIAFETMLGSKEKADALMSQAVDFAAKTPFTLADVATNIKQLLAMGIESDNVMGTLKSLGDVASGLSVPMSQLAVNYGQVATQGKLTGRELRDFSLAGVPLIEELAKNLGKTKTEIQDMVSAGNIGFKDVEAAFVSMSSEGGKFFNLMEKQSLSVTGQISNLSDKFQVMLNDIGSANTGLISGGIGALAGLIENYETIGNVLIGLVATYGAYKAAVLVSNALSTLQTQIAYQQILANIGNTGTTITLTTAEGVAAVAKSRLTAAQLALNRSMLANPYVLAATALVALAVVIYNVSEAQSEAEIAQKRYTDAVEQANTAIDEEKSKSTALLSVINDEGNSREFRNQKLNEFIKLNPEILNGLTLENIKTSEGTSMINAYVKALESKIKMQMLDTELTESIKRSAQAERGKENLGFFDKAKVAVATAIGSPTLGAITGVEASMKNNKAVIDAEKDLQKKLKAEINKATTGEEKGQEGKSPIIRNVEFFEEQVKNAKELLKKIDPSAKNYVSERKRLLNDITKGENEIDRILGKKTKAPKDTRVKDENNYEKDKLENERKAQKESESLIKNGIEAKIKLYDDELKQDGITYQKEQELLKLRIDEKKKLIDFDLKQTIKGIDDEEKEFIAKAKKAGVKNPDLSSFKSMRNTANTKAETQKEAVQVVDIQAEKDALRNLLSTFQNIKQEMFTLESEYNNDIERLNVGLLNAKTDAEKTQITQSIAERKKQFKDDKNKLSIDELMESPEWKKLFGNLDTVTTRELIRLKDKIEGQFNNMNLNPEELETLRNKIKEITGEIEQRNPFLALTEAIKKYKADSSNVNFKDLMKNIGASLQAVGNVFDQVNSSLDKLGINTTEQEKKVLEDISGMIKGAANLATGLSTGNPLQVIQGSIDLISNGIDLIAGGKDRKLDKSIQRHQGEVDKLKLSYEQLERAIDKALSSDRYSAQKATIDNLKKQQIEFAAMAQAEGDKKKTDGAKVAEYQKNIIDNVNAIEDTIAKMREDILGMDVSSVANELGSAIIDAFVAGEDAAKAWGDKVNDIVGDVIRKMLIQKLVEEPVGNIINKYMAKWVDSEGNFLGFDAVMSSAVQMGDELSAIGPGLSSALEALPDDIKKYITGDVSGASANKTALSGSIKSVSEDTAGVISGQLNAMRINQIDSISVLRQQLLSLSQIEANTQNLNGILTAMNTLVNGGRAHGLW